MADVKQRTGEVDVGPEEWRGVTMENGRVVKLELRSCLTGAVPAEIGQLTSLRVDLGNQLTSVPAEIGQLTSLRVDLAQSADELPAEIGQLTSLRELYLDGNQLTSCRRRSGSSRRWRSCTSRQSADERAGGDRAAHVAGELYLGGNQLTSVPAEIGQLTSLEELDLDGNQLTSVPAEIGQLTSLRSCTSATIS